MARNNEKERKEKILTTAELARQTDFSVFRIRVGVRICRNWPAKSLDSVLSMQGA